MTIDLYYMPASGPCRAIIMVARELNIPLNLKLVDVMKREQLKEDFVKINPQHCIPTIVDHDNGMSLWESRAILTYLVNKFAPGHTLYPTDPEKRAEIDRLLYFDIGTLYPAQSKVVYPVLKGKVVESEAHTQYSEKLTLLEKFIGDKNFLTGANMTVADLMLYGTVTTVHFVDYDLSPFKVLTAWMDRLVAKLPYNDEVNVQPIKDAKVMMVAHRAEHATQ